MEAYELRRLNSIERLQAKHDETLYGDGKEALGVVARVASLENSRTLAIALIGFLGGNLVLTALNLAVAFLAR